MEEVIERILRIESMAEEIVAEAQIGQDNIDADIEKESEALKARFHAEIDEKREAARRDEEQRAQSRLRAVEDVFKAKSARLENSYKENRSAWINGMFNNIINS